MIPLCSSLIRRREHFEADKCTSSLIPQSEAELHMPFSVTEFTDFYAGRHHATNLGTLLRGSDKALPVNWLHMPVGYNGRASSVVLTGTDIIRPFGQIKITDEAMPRFGPSKAFDFELGAIVGTASAGRISVDQADRHIFGYVLLNDWSARDIQRWEYQSLGPFQGKATSTTISAWIVTSEALDPFRVSTPIRDYELLDYLKDTGPMLYDLSLEVSLLTADGTHTVISQTNYAEIYHSSAQQLAHHTSSGCPMRVGDLLGSGTISGPHRQNCGSMIEISRGGQDPLILDNGDPRCFIEDGDLVRFTGAATGDDYQIGFGACEGRVIANKAG